MGCNNGDDSSGKASTKKPYVPQSTDTIQEETEEEEETQEVSCACGAKMESISAPEVSGITFPLISQTDQPNYWAFSKDASPKATYQEGPGVKNISLDETFELGKDLVIQKSSGCDVGFYEAKPTQVVRQRVETCSADKESCTTLAQSWTVINGKNLTKALQNKQLPQSCSWNDSPKRWKLYALSKDGFQFQPKETDQAFGLLTLDPATLKASAKLGNVSENLELNIASAGSDKPFIGSSDDKTVQLSLAGYSQGASNMTHVYGSIDIEGEKVILVGLPDPLPVLISK